MVLIPRLVSVGVPTYNRPEQLHAALDCLTNQTYPNMEIFISDNCSDPETEAVARSFTERDQRISYSRNATNLGPTVNLMSLPPRAKGEFFMWASDDDQWAPSFIEQMVDLLDKNPKATLAFCQTEYFYEGKKHPRFFQGAGIQCAPDTSQREMLRHAIHGNYGELFYGLYRTGSLVDRGGANFEHDEFIYAPLKALTVGTAVISNEFLFRKSIPEPGFLWTYVCARAAGNPSVPSIDKLLERRGKPRYYSRKTIVKTATWFTKYYMSSAEVLGRINLQPENVIQGRMWMFKYLVRKYFWTIRERDFD